MAIDTKLRNKLLLTSLLQGLALLYLRLSIKHEFWPALDPQWLTPLYTVAVAGPLLVLLGLNSKNGLKTLKYVAVFSAVLFPIGYYIGTQLIPFDLIRSGAIYWMYGWNMVIATFLFLIYLQQYQAEGNFSYTSLVKYSWRNFLTGALAALFTLIFFGILMLWAELFKLIQIDFFDELFDEDWFRYPVLSVAFGFAIWLVRSQTKIVDTIRNIQQLLMKYLLLVLILVLIIFVLTFPFTGLQTLWDTRSGSTIILWLQALALFFVNAVYQGDQHGEPYPKYIHRFVYTGIALLPVYSAISFYGLSLRIGQYGWSVDRALGMFIWTMFALFSLGYLVGIIMKRDQWTSAFAWINVRMGIILMLALLVVNSPLLDFRKISTASLMARLGPDFTQLEQMDIFYIQRELGKPGYLALEKLKEELKDKNPTLAERIDRLQNSPIYKYEPLEKEDFLSSLNITPKNTILPDGLGDEIYGFYTRYKFSNNTNMYLIVADFDNDEQNEYLILGSSYGQLYKNSQMGWLSFDINRDFKDLTSDHVNLLENSEYNLILPTWNKLQIGDRIISIKEAAKEESDSQMIIEE